MPLLDSPVPPATDAPLEPLALPPLRSLGNLRYKSSSDIQSLLDGCAPCLLGDKEISVLQPPAKLSALYRKLDSLFKSEKGEARREAVRNAIAEFSQTATREDWQRYAHFFDGHYTRNLVGATEEFEMMVICWSNSQKSRIHNHAGGECFVGTLQGPLTERLYDNFMDRERMERNDPKDLQVMEYTGEIKEIGRSVLETGMVGYIDDSIGLHAMHAENGDCVTLHIYSPPTRVSTVVEPENAMVLQRIPGFWSYGGVLLAQ